MTSLKLSFCCNPRSFSPQAIHSITMTVVRFTLLASVYLAVLNTVPQPHPLAQAAIFVTPGNGDGVSGNNDTASDDGETADVPVEVVFATPVSGGGDAGQRPTHGLDVARMVASQMTEQDILVLVCDNLPSNVIGCSGVPDMQ